MFEEIIQWLKGSSTKRWLFFLPISIICTVLGGIIWWIMGHILTRGLSEGYFYNIYHDLLRSFFEGYIFVYVGGYINPHKIAKSFLITLVVIYFLFSIYVQLFVFENINYWMFFTSLVFFIGGFLGRYEEK